MNSFYWMSCFWSSPWVDLMVHLVKYRMNRSLLLAFHQKTCSRLAELLWWRQFINISMLIYSSWWWMNGLTNIRVHTIGHGFGRRSATLIIVWKRNSRACDNVGYGFIFRLLGKWLKTLKKAFTVSNFRRYYELPLLFPQSTAKLL